MYPGTKFNWYDASQFATTTNAIALDNAPLFLTAFSSDKGSEDMIRISGQDFYRMYGDSLSFAKHGQVLLQAGKLIDAGAELLCKRIVASEVIAYDDLGTEAIRKLTVEELPVVVIIDTEGNNLYEMATA